MMTRIITLMLTLSAVLHANAQITIDQRIDTMQILIGEQTNLTISATIKHGQKIAFPSFKRSQYITPGLEVLENLESSFPEDKGRRKELSNEGTCPEGAYCSGRHSSCR